MDKNILKPLYEFGALIRYCEENNMTRESLIIHTGTADLSRVYYKVLNGLSGENLEFFEFQVLMAYERLVRELEG